MQPRRLELRLADALELPRDFRLVVAAFGNAGKIAAVGARS